MLCLRRRRGFSCCVRRGSRGSRIQACDALKDMAVLLKYRCVLLELWEIQVVLHSLIMRHWGMRILIAHLAHPEHFPYLVLTDANHALLDNSLTVVRQLANHALLDKCLTVVGQVALLSPQLLTPQAAREVG